MITKRVSFSNTQLDSFGMPTDYRSYLIRARVAEPGEANKGDGIAKVYIFSAQAPALNPNHVVAAGGEENAVALAIEKLKVLNPGLNIRIIDNENL